MKVGPWRWPEGWDQAGCLSILHKWGQRPCTGGCGDLPHHPPPHRAPPSVGAEMGRKPGPLTHHTSGGGGEPYSTELRGREGELEPVLAGGLDAWDRSGFRTGRGQNRHQTPAHSVGGSRAAVPQVASRGRAEGGPAWRGPSLGCGEVATLAWAPSAGHSGVPIPGFWSPAGNEGPAWRIAP